MLYTASGARRSGDEYQNLQSAELLIEWLEHPNAYHWVRLETMEGSLDDIQAESANCTRRMLQIKFGTDPTEEWEWNHLIKREAGKKGPKPSLLQKWKNSLEGALKQGVIIGEAALLTNRPASAEIRAHLSDDGLIDFAQLSTSQQKALATHLGDAQSAATFFSTFHFFFKQRSLDVLRTTLWERFRRLGGTKEGWSSLLERVQRWINHRDEPPPSGTITLDDVRAAALWHLPPQIPQEFLVPKDYVAPADWSAAVVEPLLRVGRDRLVVVTGSPGAGKSTYLSWLADRLRAHVPVVRHHYFLSVTDATPNRTAWETAADALIGQLLRSYGELVRTVDSQNPQPEKLRDFLVAAGRVRAGKDPLVVIIDGLDHVWRDTGHEEGLRRLFDLMLPAPEGVVVLTGTQNLDTARIPRKIHDLCLPDKWLRVPVLDQGEVREWLTHHESELGLPEEGNHANHLRDELTQAFHEVSGGHPLILHYTFSATQRINSTVRAADVRALPVFDANSGVATYYQGLWDSISSEGHSLLHLLAGFRWAWPRGGLLQCLAPQAGLAQLERAEGAIRHVLGNSRTGVTAFHESLLAFVRVRVDHEDAAGLLRPLVLRWLTSSAPYYWRWRYEWDLRAQDGDAGPLISGVTLNWCIDSLVAGRGRPEIAELVAASGWATLKEGMLGVATERHYLDTYLDEAKHAEGVLSRLLWLALHGLDLRDRELEFKLFCARKTKVTEEEIESCAEMAFAVGQIDICRELFHECAARWNALAQRADSTGRNFANLEQVFPSLIAMCLATAKKGPYQTHVSEHGGEPNWCESDRYAKALGRYCAVGDDTSAIREELQFVANHLKFPSLGAVDEIVRLSCREGFDPNAWITNPEARKSGLFRSHQRRVQGGNRTFAAPLRSLSFGAIKDTPYRDTEGMFAELARCYFFSCLAEATEGRELPDIVGVDSEAHVVSYFLSLLGRIAGEASESTRVEISGGWFITRLATISPLGPEATHFRNRLARPASVARVIVAIAQDLDELHYAKTRKTSLTREVIELAVDGSWTTAMAWIEDRVERRLAMRDPHSARLLADRERNRLEHSRGSLHTRAAEYASLAQFCLLHRMPPDEVRMLARLSARNLLGHGYHKDMVLFDVIDGIRAYEASDKRTRLAQLKSITPIVRVVDDITDSDETRYLKRDLAEALAEIAPDVLPNYMRSMQRAGEHWMVELSYTEYARTSSLSNSYEKALSATLVHEKALAAFQKRVEGGDTDAGAVLTNILSYCGRHKVPEETPNSAANSGIKGEQKSPPVPAEYPPAKLSDFMQATREAGIYSDEHLATWTAYWRDTDPVGLLDVLTAYRGAHGIPHERSTAKLVIELAFERLGRRAGWEWIVTYHRSMYGWSRYLYGLKDIMWMWEFVQSRFPERWLEFILETSRLAWRDVGSGPHWDIERMVRYLQTVGQADRAGEVLEAAVRWGSGLAADMALPDPGLESEATDLPPALQLLVDRLDCPSRMVQERAIQVLAQLLSVPDETPAVSRALLDWHGTDALEMRSCVLLLVLCLAHTAYGVSADVCVLLAERANLTASIGSDLLLRVFGAEGSVLADSLNYRSMHTGAPEGTFSRLKEFQSIVSAHLAPAFGYMARKLDSKEYSFSKQWEWEAFNLAKKHGLSLWPDAHYDHHYRENSDAPPLAINDQLSMTLRSAYLRTLHWSVDRNLIPKNIAEVHARFVAILADPVSLAIAPSPRPQWWPPDPGDSEDPEVFRGIVARTVVDHLDRKGSEDAEVLFYAAGPLGSGTHFRADLKIRAFLQAAHDSMKPPADEVAQIPEIACQPIPPRMSLTGTYLSFDEQHAGFVRDWLLAPLAWEFLPEVQDWLAPMRQRRGIHLPALWLLPGAPTINSSAGHINITLANQSVGRYHFWCDDLHERWCPRAPSRVGGELRGQRQWLEPHLKAGAQLCWLVTLSLFPREKYGDRYSKRPLVRSWLAGGSRIVRTMPWRLPDT